ncbi:MAG: alpha/beta fold hydrolase [Leptolyngbyaceae cyanobacterium MO_188.B28]|nr:alpha/beta fold hydrolase [Leptolyngbyaceae cyanobacterium MO_188.B28]
MSIPEKRLRFLTPKDPNPALPLFIYLPGMDGAGTLLEIQLKRLTTAFDVRCLSIPPDDLTDWPGLVEQTATLIRTEQKLTPNRPIYLCGESFGGCLALNLAIQNPKLTNRMILVNPASSFSQQAIMHWGASITQWLPTSLYQLSAVGLLPFLIAPERVAPPVRMALLSAMQSVEPSSAAWRISLLGQFGLSGLPLQQITQPVLVIASGADRILPSIAEAERLVRSLPHARKLVLPQSGHACLLETTVNLGEILRSQGFFEGQTNTQNFPAESVKS